MMNKKIHEDFIKLRNEKLKEPEVQNELRATILRAFDTKVTLLPRHAWEYGLSFGVLPEDALEVLKRLRDENEFAFNFLIDITAVDWLDRKVPRFEVVYQLLSLPYLHRVCIKVAVTEENPEVYSVRSLWPAANFLEREVWDMYGIKFKGHGDLRRILLYDEFVGHPLRKDYPIRGKQPRVPLRVPELRNTADDMHREELVALPHRRKVNVNG